MRSHFLRAANDKAVSCSYVTTVTSTTDTQFNTFTSVNLGTAASDRYIIVAIQHFGTNTSVQSVFIAGSAATIHYNATGTGIPAFAGRLVTAGTTGAISVNTVDPILRIAVSVYAVYGLNSFTPLSIGSVLGLSGSSATVSNLTTSYGGVVIAAVSSGQTNSYTLSGVTEQYDQILESASRYAGGYDLTNSASTSYSVSATPSANQASRLVALTWR